MQKYGLNALQPEKRLYWLLYTVSYGLAWSGGETGLISGGYDRLHASLLGSLDLPGLREYTLLVCAVRLLVAD